MFFKLLFPSWKFFEDFRTFPKLHYRFGLTPSVYSPWRPYSPEVKSNALTLLLNAEGNLRLYGQSLIDRFAAGDSSFLPLIENLVQLQLPAMYGGQFQFKITFEDKVIFESMDLKI